MSLGRAPRGREIRPVLVAILQRKPILPQHGNLKARHGGIAGTSAPGGGSVSEARSCAHVRGRRTHMQPARHARPSCWPRESGRA